MRKYVLLLMFLLINISLGTDTITDSNGNKWEFDSQYCSVSSNRQIISLDSHPSCLLTLLEENVDAGEPFVFKAKVLADGDSFWINVGGQYIGRVRSNSYQIISGATTITVNYPFGQNWKVFYDGNYYYFFVDEVLLKKWQAQSDGVFQLVNIYYDNKHEYSDISLTSSFTDSNGNKWDFLGTCDWWISGSEIFSKSTGPQECYLNLTEYVGAGEPFVFKAKLLNDGSEHGIKIGGQYIRRVGSDYQILTGKSTMTINGQFGKNWKVVYDGKNYHFFVDEVLLSEWQASSNGVFQLVDDRNDASNDVYKYSDISLTSSFTDSNGNKWNFSGTCDWWADGSKIYSKSTGPQNCYLTLSENINAGEPFIFKAHLLSGGSEHGIKVGGQYIRRFGNHYQIINGTTSITIDYPFGQNWKVIYNGKSYYFFVNEVMLKKWDAPSNGVFQLVDDRNDASNDVYKYSDISLNPLPFSYNYEYVSGGIPDGYCYSNYDENGVSIGRVDPDGDIDCCLLGGHMSAGYYNFPSFGVTPCCDNSDNWCADFGCCVNGVWKKGYTCTKDSDCPSDGCYNHKYRDYSCVNGKCSYTESCSRACFDSSFDCCNNNDCPTYVVGDNFYHHPCRTYNYEAHCTRTVQVYDYKLYSRCWRQGDVSCSFKIGWAIVFFCTGTSCEESDCVHTLNCDPLKDCSNWKDVEHLNWVQTNDCEDGWVSCNDFPPYGETDGCETEVPTCNVYCKYNPHNADWVYWYDDCRGGNYPEACS